MTVGELKAILEEYEDNWPIVFSYYQGDDNTKHAEFPTSCEESAVAFSKERAEYVIVDYKNKDQFPIKDQTAVLELTQSV